MAPCPCQGLSPAYKTTGSSKALLLMCNPDQTPSHTLGFDAPPLPMRMGFLEYSTSQRPSINVESKGSLVGLSFSNAWDRLE